jgi:hypothetical protein
MKIRMALIVFGCLGVCLLAGCASPRSPVVGVGRDDSSQSRLPPEVAFNRDAGRGRLLMVTLRVASGEELPFVIDTGSGGSCLDASLESKLGQAVGTEMMQMWGKISKKNVYAMPPLYLGDVRLLTGDRVLTMDLKPLAGSGRIHLAGILGMDVWEHYCIQLDFTAHRLRFLDDAHADNKSWGRAFPIVALNDKDNRPAVAENLLGRQGPHSLIDSGYDTTGWLMPVHYEQWTNQASLPAAGEARAPDVRFGGETYPHSTLVEEKVEADGIGLPFLARHLVTLDFPRHMLYLKRTSR